MFACVPPAKVSVSTHGLSGNPREGLVSLFDRRADDLFGQAEWACSRPFLGAAMAAVALVACADDKLFFARRAALADILERADTPKAFDPDAANNLFSSFATGIRSQPEQGRAAALSAVSALSGDTESARLLIRICNAVGRADGGLTARELAVIDEICAILNITVPDAFEQTSVNPAGEGPAPFLIALGNEKGGTGKSTTALHLVVALLKLGYKVGSIDLDGRQATLSRFLANRGALAKATDQELPMPLHRRIERSRAAERDAAEREDEARLHEAVAELADRQIVVVDTPGSDSYLSRLAHANADMLITPINDTLLDIDILAHIDPNKREVRAPSAYCEMVWKQNERRVSSGRKPIDWIVMRNRLTHIDAHNKRAVADLLDQLSKRIGFRLAAGFGERVVFHELFLTGLTVLDLTDNRLRGWNNASLSHARREIDDLLLAVGLPEPEIASGVP
jgi:chromosome partitioning protein